MDIKITDVLQDYYKQYIVCVNSERSIPSINDTLKPVHRRILLSAYKVGLSSTKSARIVGHCISNYHPHGDAAIYGALVTLVKNGLLIGRGNFGSNIGLGSIEPAAMRYTEAHLNPFIKEIAFSYIKYVPHFRNDLGVDEPVYLPTMLPLSMLYLTYEAEPINGIGVGVTTQLPLFKVDDLVKLLLAYIENKATKTINTYYRDMRCQFNVNKIGTQQCPFPLELKQTNDGIVIKGIPFMMRQKLTNFLIDNKLKWVDRSRDKTDILVYTKNKNIFNKLHIRAARFNLLFVKDNELVLCSLINILDTIYNNYKGAVKAKFENDINHLQLLQTDYEILVKLKAQYQKLKSLEPKELINLIISKFKIDNETANRIYNTYSIKDLHEAPQKLEDIKKQLKQLTHNLEHLDEYCYNEYKGLI